jgi:hypothetical protein
MMPDDDREERTGREEPVNGHRSHFSSLKRRRCKPDDVDELKRSIDDLKRILRRQLGDSTRMKVNRAVVVNKGGKGSVSIASSTQTTEGKEEETHG